MNNDSLICIKQLDMYILEIAISWNWVSDRRDNVCKKITSSKKLFGDKVAANVKLLHNYNPRRSDFNIATDCRFLENTFPLDQRTKS